VTRICWDMGDSVPGLFGSASGLAATTRSGSVLTVDFGPIGGGGAHLLSDPIRR
jgi:hypothetical protein